MHNREKVYDKEIAPLMAKIIKICEDNDIPFYADFAISDKQSEFCASGHLEMPIYQYLYKLRKCGQNDGINMDLFLMSVAKSKNASSSMMDMIFKNGEWRSKK